MTTPYLMDGSGNISIIYALSNDGSYNQLYGISGDKHEYMVDITNTPFIGYNLDNKLVFYNASGELFVFKNDSINTDIDMEKLT
jgi:hypothetical protein